MVANVDRQTLVRRITSLDHEITRTGDVLERLDLVQERITLRNVLESWGTLSLVSA